MNKIRLNLEQKIAMFLANTSLVGMFVFLYLIELYQPNYPIPEALPLFALAIGIGIGAWFAIVWDVHIIFKLREKQK